MEERRTASVVFTGFASTLVVHCVLAKVGPIRHGIRKVVLKIPLNIFRPSETAYLVLTSQVDTSQTKYLIISVP